MAKILRAFPILAALIAAPALGAPADKHADHHPQASTAPASAKVDPKANGVGCPGVAGQSAGGHMANGQAMTEHMNDHMANGQMMAGSAGMMTGAPNGQGMAAGQMMGGGQTVGNGMMAGGQNTNCPRAGKPAAGGKK